MHSDALKSVHVCVCACVRFFPPTSSREQPSAVNAAISSFAANLRTRAEKSRTRPGTRMRLPGKTSTGLSGHLPAEQRAPIPSCTSPKEKRCHISPRLQERRMWAACIWGWGSGSQAGEPGQGQSLSRQTGWQAPIPEVMLAKAAPPTLGRGSLRTGRRRLLGRGPVE